VREVHDVMTLSMYLAMVVQVVIRQKGERKVRAEDWTARSMSSLAPQLIKILNIPMTHQGYVSTLSYHISPTVSNNCLV
jgi:hypothetical protein